MIFIRSGHDQHAVRRISADRSVGDHGPQRQHNGRRVGRSQRIRLGCQIASSTFIRLVEHFLNLRVVILIGGDDQHFINHITAECGVRHHGGQGHRDRGGIGPLQGIGFRQQIPAATLIGLIDHLLNPEMIFGRCRDNQRFVVDIGTGRGIGCDRLDRVAQGQRISELQRIDLGGHFALAAPIGLVHNRLHPQLVFS